MSASRYLVIKLKLLISGTEYVCVSSIYRKYQACAKSSGGYDDDDDDDNDDDDDDNNNNNNNNNNTVYWLQVDRHPVAVFI